MPLESWLRNAEHLSAPRRETAVFREALGAMAARREGVNRPTDGDKTPFGSPIWLVPSSTALVQHPDFSELVRIMKEYRTFGPLQSVVAQTGFDIGLVAWERGLDEVAKALVSAAFKSGHLKAVIVAMSEDSIIRRWREDLEAMWE